MRQKDSRLWAYNAILIAIVLVVGTTIGWPHAPWPPLWTMLVLVALQLLVWQYGFPAPALGMLSMERMPQVAALCLFPFAQAALLMAVPALLWPFFNRRYRQNSWVVGLQRALHNSCMIWLMGTLAGMVYQSLDGPLPLRAIEPASIVAVAAMALTLQLINMVMIIVFYALDGRDYRRLVTPGFLLFDLCFVPFGVLLALIFAKNNLDVQVLFLLLVVLMVLSSHALDDSRRKIQLRLETLDAAIGHGPGEPGLRRVDKVLEGLYRRVHTLFQSRILFIALHDVNRGDFDLRVEEVDGERRPPSRRPLAVGLAGEVFASGQPVLIDDWSRAPDQIRQRAVLMSGERPGCVLMVPLSIKGRVLGVMSVQHSDPHYYSTADKNALLALAEDSAPLIADGQTFDNLDELRLRLEDSVAERTRALAESLEANTALLAELQSKSELLSRQSREDVLTGLANRRRFDEQLRLDVQRVQRYGGMLSLVLLDLDNFKRVNDSAGHAAGDEVLRTVATIMKAQARASDLVARVGGEEFVLVLPEQSTDGAYRAADLLRAAIAAHDFTLVQPGLVVTLSAGIACWAAGESCDDLLRRADQAMYQAKVAGRNRVCIHAAPA